MSAVLTKSDKELLHLIKAYFNFKIVSHTFPSFVCKILYISNFYMDISSVEQHTVFAVGLYYYTLSELKN